MNGLQAIKRYESGDMTILKTEKWLLHLALTSEENVNLERVNLIAGIQNYVLAYVRKTLVISEHLSTEETLLDCTIQSILDQVLTRSEVAKTGMAHTRENWKAKGYNLFAHNIGSYQIYLEHLGLKSIDEATPSQQLVATLIMTHGLIGQYLRGETTLQSNQPLVDFMHRYKLDMNLYKKLLLGLNQCIIQAVSEDLWFEIAPDIESSITTILKEQWDASFTTHDRLKALRKSSIQNGEDFEGQFLKLSSFPTIKERLTLVLNHCETWYVEAALHDFSFEEFTKIFLLISQNLNPQNMSDAPLIHVSFEKLMNALYYDRKHQKKLNLYKKRIIENYLKGFTLETLATEKVEQDNIHVSHQLTLDGKIDNLLFFEFHFSPAAEQLIKFCEEAEKSDVLYEKAIILLYDLFHLRRDAYDRFYEEEAYLQTMNQSIDYKAIILDYLVGETIVDIGPGGGALMDLIETKESTKRVIGVDISENVIDALKKRKQMEGKSWEVQFGDALNLGSYFEQGAIHTIIFCSILHELYSYIPYEGKKFNKDTLKAAIKSAYEVLPIGGRIIIRDGIMTEPQDQNRIIRFLSEDGLAFLKKYQSDFQGRAITFDLIAHNEVILPINDAMEFLYTYTWGEASYVHEINEQFGYFTPSEYVTFIHESLGENAKIIVANHYLQNGYTIALSSKIELFDENHTKTVLPDSTCFIVIEKT